MMFRALLLLFMAALSPLTSADEVDGVIDEIFFLYDAEARWSSHAANSVRQRRESLKYPELYQHEMDRWLQNELSWNSVEQIFRNELRGRYTTEELVNIAQTLREYPSGYSDDPSRKSYGSELFQIGAVVAQRIYPPLLARLANLRSEYEPGTGENNQPRDSSRSTTADPNPDIEKSSGPVRSSTGH